MRILQVLDSLNVGGSESLAATLAERFSARGYASRICALGSDGALRQRLDGKGIPAMHFDASSGIRPGAMFRLGRLMHYGADVVVTHHFRQLVHAVPGAFALRKKLVHVEHDYHSYEDRPDVMRRFEQIAPAVHSFIFVSDEIRDWFARRMPRAADRCISVPNGVDTIRFRPNQRNREDVRELLGIAPEARVIGTCARMEPVKDLNLLIEGFAELVGNGKEEGHPLNLVLLGDGSRREALQSRAEELGVLGRCRFPGMVQDVHRWLNALDVYSITSRDEGLPLSVMEAMSTELPVVSVNVGSIGDVVDDEVGTMLEGRSPSELAGALEALLRNEMDRKKRAVAARARIMRGHSVEAMVEAYLDAFHEE